MTHALSPLYIGPLEPFLPPRITAAAESDTQPARELLNPNYLIELLDRFAAQYQQGDRRAVASLWSKWHFSTLFVHGLAANLVLERDLPLGLDDLHLEQSAGGQTTGLVLRHAGGPLSELDPHLRFATLLDGHLTPLVEALSSASGASPRVFWSNAGNYFEYFAGALTEHPMASPDVAEPAQALLECRILPDGRRNPLYRPVRYVEADEAGSPHRVRRLCCIRYLIDELGVCANCPLACRRTPRAARETQASTPALSAREQPRLERVRLALCDDPARGHRLEDLAGLAAMSPASLRRKFKAAFGRSVFDYLRDCRLTLARDYLRQGYSVQQAAHFSGYRHASNFATAFRRHYGVAPSSLTKPY